MLKLPDFVKILKLCFTRFNNNLPDQFNHLLSRLTDGNTHHLFKNKIYKLPLVKHEFAKSSTGYNIVRIINNTPNTITDKIYTHSSYGLLHMERCKYRIVIILMVQYWIGSFVVIIKYNTVYNNLFSYLISKI